MPKSLSKLSLTLAASLAASAVLAADTYTFDKSHTDVSFQIRHFVTKVRGRFSDFQGTIELDHERPESSSVDFSIKASSIDTNNERRDNDLRSANFLEVEKYPEITFKSSKVEAKGQDAYHVTGTLTMHGVSKEITLPVRFLGLIAAGRNDKAGFEVETTLDRKDFGITWNRALDGGGFMLGDDVAVSISVEANKKKPEAPPAQ